MRALKPGGVLANSEDPGPLSDVINTMVSGAADDDAPALPPSTGKTPHTADTATAASPILPSRLEGLFIVVVLPPIAPSGRCRKP
jgi:hypothetical protein